MGRFLFLNLLFQLLWLNFTYGQLFDYGERYGDRIERYSENQLAITFTLPIVYLEKSYDELFISFDGIAGFQKLPTEYTPLQNMNISTIAVYYAPVTNTHLYYRVTSSNRNLLHKLNEFIHESFDDAIEFHTLEAVIVTWERVKNHETNSAEATFQLALATDGRESYCIMQYRNLPWAASKGFFAQSGFTHQDGRHTLNTNSGTSLVNELINLSNTKSDKYSGFAFRISGSAIEDPKEDPENYDYRSYEDSYENDVDHKEPENCPEDPYKDKCPQECTILYDQRGCSKCVCAEVAKQENSVELEESSKYQTHREPPAMKQTKSGIHFPENVCESEANDCNENAECESYKTGHCCRCSEGWTGNGHTCIVKGDPVRISGNFEGVINGKPIDKTDLHTFVTTTDGRSFTAVSKISSDLGHSFLLLHPIGSVMGWLFAVAGPDAYNGFELTGGVLNRTVALHIGDRYRVSIRQEFHGQDDYQYLKSNVYIHGTLPEVAPGAEVTVPDYVEEYKRESPGFLRSYTTADVKVKEGQDTQTYRMIVDQQIHYKECPHKPFDLDPNQSLYVERVHVVYSEENDGIVRYGSKNTIRKTSDKTSQVQQQPAFERKQHGQPQQQVHAPVNLQQAQVSGSNPCAEGQHRCTLPNMKCRVVDPSYRCECHPGYQAQHDHTSPIGWRCIDLDECQRGDHSCDRQHASCMNTEGSFKCRCMDGYTGNGYQCFPLDSGADLNIQPPRQQQEQGQTNIGSNECTSHSQCHQWGECVFTPGNPRGHCKCRGWYQGDGVKHCGPPGDRQPQLNANIPKAGGKPCGTHVCSENAECMPDTRGGSECVCKVGTVCRSHEECSHHGSCAYSHALGYYQCACTPPYIGNGIDCNLPGQPSQSGDEIDIPSNQPQGCDVTQDCSEFADCIFERTKEGGIYKCVCQAGYTGDGKYCMASQLGIQGLPPLQPLGCDVLKSCDANAQCVYDSHTNTHKCECYEGYVGNGQTCVLIHSGQKNWEGQPQRPGPKQCREQTDCHQNAHCVVTEDGRTNICECLPGFRGDGVTQCADADECSPVKLDSCRQNEECVFGDKEQAYVCKCMKGFMGEPGKCRPHAPPTTCQENPRLCHANAQCIFRHETNRHECLCKPGSVGDGYQRCDVMESPQCSNCSIHAHCAQNPVTGGWTCKCNVGFTGNGIICGATSKCMQMNYRVSHKFACQPSVNNVMH
ncbi:hypothetical protein WR25_10468 [Diploscapter pachys]|uniref:Uncharacterized protein n=1 Tax=Diploscapter pachys TaxID=2018661 RepID=A0A2A2JBB7_9BILA|nr:hypothetical protein WR25_10468 [Diploscapter pachys]